MLLSNCNENAKAVMHLIQYFGRGYLFIRPVCVPHTFLRWLLPSAGPILKMLLILPVYVLYFRA